MGTKPLTQTTGRRKHAICRARLRPGTGIVTINDRVFEEYFPSEVQRNSSTEALRITNTQASYDVDADIVGGGIAGQNVVPAVAGAHHHDLLAGIFVAASELVGMYDLALEVLNAGDVRPLRD